MKNINVLAFALLCSAPLSTMALETPTVIFKPEFTFLPAGFDSNDNAQIVVYGKIHDICHRVLPSSFEVNQTDHQIFVKSESYRMDRICADVYVNTPYTHVLNLGSLAPAVYEVFTIDAAGAPILTGVLPIKPAPVGGRTDDFLYAQVEEVNTVKVSTQDVLPIVLKGKITNSCLKFKEVKTVLNTGGVYDVLPIFQISGTHCVETNKSFEMKVNLPNFPRTPTLINVRAMAGQSVERVIDTRGMIE